MLVREMFGKPYKELTEEERRKYKNACCKRWYNKHKKVKPEDRESLPFKKFGKPFKELTKEEVLEYYSIKNAESYARKRSKPRKKEGLCYDLFGVSFKDLDAQQKREYNRIMKRKERERKNGNITDTIWEEV